MRALALLTFTALAAPAWSAPQDHALITPYAGSVLTRREDDGHKTHKIVVGLDATGKTDDEVMRSVEVSGQLTRLYYENPKGRSHGEVAANYRDALQAAGFEILLSCDDKACGPSWASSRWGRVGGIKYASSSMSYVAAKRRSGDAEVYVAVSVIKPRHEIHVVELKAMDRGKVTVTTEAIVRGLEADGRVVLDGLFFDHDKATLTPESTPALEVIAKFLEADPKLEVFIVGHTDGVGAIDYNLGLSRDRAAAVVDALVTRYKIAPKRLQAHGVGPLAPSKANKSDAGRARNRRVEMVSR